MNSSRKTVIILLLITLSGLFLRIWGAGHGIADELFIYPDELAFAYDVESFANGSISKPLWPFSPLWVYIHTIGVYIYSFLEGLLKYFFNIRQTLIEMPDVYMITLIGRIIAGIFGAMTIPVVYLIGKRLYNERTGMLSAGIMAVLYLHVAESHFAYVDVPQTLFLAISFYYMVKVSSGGGKGDSLLSGFFLALAIATKISAGPGVVPLLIAHYIREKGIKKLISSKYIYISLFGLVLGYGLCAPWFLIKPDSLVGHIGGLLHLLYSRLSPASRYGGPFDLFRGIKHLSIIIFEYFGPYVILLSLLVLVIIVIKKQWKVFFLLSFPLFYLPFFIMAAWHDPKEIVPVLPFLVVFMAYGLSSIVDILSVRKKGTVMFVISMFFIIPSFWNDLKADYFFWHRDTRSMAADWIRENLPWDARIGIEGYRLYNIPIYHERYQISQEFSGLPFEELRKEVDFVVISSIIYDNSSPGRKLYYDSLREKAQLMKVFKTYSWYFFNPRIEIYRLSRQGEALTSAIPRTYSERGSFDISSEEGAYGKESLSFWINQDERVKRILVSEKKLDIIGIFLYNGQEKTELKIRNVLKGEKVTLNPYERRVIIVNPSLSFPYTNYIYNISVISGRGGGAFVNILTDPKRIANTLLEIGEWEQAISILSKTGSLDQEGWSLLGLAYSMNGIHKEALASFSKGMTPSVKELLDSDEWEKTFEKFNNIDSAFLKDSLAVEYSVDQFQQQVGRKMGWMAHFEPRFDRPGFLLFGPYKRFPRGHFKAIFKVRIIDSDNSPAARIDVFNGDNIIAERVIKDTKGVVEEFTLNFYNDEPDRAIEFRVEAIGKRELWVEEIKVFPDIYNYYRSFFGMVYHYRGLSAGNKGLLEEAIEHFKSAGLLGYNETEGLYQMGRVYEKMGMKEEAIGTYKRVIESIPNHIGSLLALRGLSSQGTTGLEERIKAITPQHEIIQNIGDSIEFIGYSIDKEKFHKGEELNISYFWRASKKIRSNYSVFVHFRRDGSSVFQNDHRPFLPMIRWKEGEVVKENYNVKVPENVQGGRYNIVIGLWDIEGSKERLRLKGQAIDEIKIGSIEIQ